MPIPDLHDDDIHIDAADGAVVMRMHPDDAVAISNALRAWAIAHPDDETIPDWTADVTEAIDKAVWRLGYDPSNATRFDPDTTPSG